MDFRLLGPLQVIEDGVSLPLGGLRQRHALALLLIRRGGVVDPRFLIDQMWGGSPPPSAETSLQVAVSKLRKILGTDRIRTRPGGYELVAERGEADADRFERAVEDGRVSVTRGDPGSAARLLRYALSEWTGDALDGLPDGDLLTAERSRLGELKMGALETLMEAELARGRQVDVLPELIGLASAHPLHERLQGHLMLGLYRAGRQSDALAAYARLYGLLVEELGVEPNDDIANLQQRILRQDPALAGPPSRKSVSRLPTPATALLGRDGELDKLALMIEQGVRLVSITGPGGVGKTSLMLALARRIDEMSGDDREEGAFVDLSALPSPELVIPSVSNALGIIERGDRSVLNNLVQTLEHRRLILLLDNFEKVLDASEDLATMLASCPGLQLIVTSRERLALRGEHEFALAPLDVPASSIHGAEALAQYDAVRLFCHRVRAVQPDFELNDANSATVGELCRQLDGLPLALELAAARAKVLSLAALLVRLRNGHQSFLSGGPRDSPERHRALDTAIAWSYDSLSAEESRVLLACSVFAGGASIESVEDVCEHLPPELLLDLIGSLIDKSLISRQDLGAQNGTRIAMLETIRAFCAERLIASGEDRAFRALHAASYAKMVSVAKTGLWTHDHDDLMSALDADIDNLRAAYDWLSINGPPGAATRMCADLGRYWVFRGTLAEGALWLTRAIEQSSEATISAVLHSSLADIEARQGKLTPSVAQLPQALEVLKSSPQQIAYAAGMTSLSDALWQHGHYEEAVSAAEHGVAAARELGLPLLTAYTVSILGVTLAELGRHELGLELMAESARLVGNGSQYFTGMITTNLAWSLIQTRQYEEARGHLVTAIPFETGKIKDRDLYNQASARNNLGWACLGTGEPRSALTEFCFATEYGHRLGDVSIFVEGLIGIGCAAAALELPGLPEQSFELAKTLQEPLGLQPLPYVTARKDDVMITLPARPPVALSPERSPLELVALARSLLAVEQS